MLIIGVPEEEKNEQGAQKIFTNDGKNLINFMKILIWWFKKIKSKRDKQRSMTKCIRVNKDREFLKHEEKYNSSHTRELQ